MLSSAVKVESAGFEDLAANVAGDSVFDWSSGLLSQAFHWLGWATQRCPFGLEYSEIPLDEALLVAGTLAAVERKREGVSRTPYFSPRQPGRERVFRVGDDLPEHFLAVVVDQLGHRLIVLKIFFSCFIPPKSSPSCLLSTERNDYICAVISDLKPVLLPLQANP